jgi:hypothetical protein
MKSIKLFAAVAAIVFSLGVFLSCSKETTQTNTTPTYPIQGLWVGSYTVDGQPGLGTQYYSFVIKPDGTMIGDSKSFSPVQQHLTTGTWSLADTTLTCSFTCVYGLSANIGAVQSCTSKWDKTGKLTGTWRNIAGIIAGSGTFTMNRIN